MLLLELAASLALLALDALAFLQRQHLLVLDTQLAALELKVIEVFDHDGGLLGRGEIGKGQASEDAVIEVVVEGVRQRQTHFRHQLHQLLLLHRERDVFDDDGGRDELVVAVGRDGVGSSQVLTDGLAQGRSKWRMRWRRMVLVLVLVLVLVWVVLVWVVLVWVMLVLVLRLVLVGRKRWRWTGRQV